MTIGFIGLGNMASAMIGGIIRSGLARPEEIIGNSKTEGTMERMHESFGIKICHSAAETAQAADIVVLAVKPQVLPLVLPELAGVIGPEKVLLSVAAGKSMEWIASFFPGDVAIVRCMPNTPALVGSGCSGVCRNGFVSDEMFQKCLAIAGSFGVAEEVSERLMDTVGAVSGASPAWVFMMIEALADGAVKGGMPRAQAIRFAAQSVMGAGQLVLETGKHPAELKDMVCSPGGTTIEGVEALERAGFRSALMQAMSAAIEKSRKL